MGSGNLGRLGELQTRQVCVCDKVVFSGKSQRLSCWEIRLQNKVGPSNSVVVCLLGIAFERWKTTDWGTGGRGGCQDFMGLE